MSKIIGIIGTRKRNTMYAFKKIRKIFDEIYNIGDVICSGGCSKGGDRYAEILAKDEGIEIDIIYPAYKKFGNGAAFIRNGKIANKCDILIACVMEPEDGIEEVLKRDKGGTEDTLKKFYKKNQNNNSNIYLV